MQKLVRDLQAIEGVPTDSESLEQAFHAHGINIRYLGEVAKIVADKELSHLKSLLEREGVVRSVKHLFNDYLRETPDSHVSLVLAHLFNLLLAPYPLLDQLEEGSIKYPLGDTHPASKPVSSLAPK
jgi:protein TIF31